MEGVSFADLNTDQNIVYQNTALKKGLLEELGITGETMEHYKVSYEFCDFFLKKNYFEVGVTATVRFDDLYEEIIRDLPAKDKEMEIEKLTPIRLSKKELEKFINRNSLYYQGLYTLKMICARERVFINLPRVKVEKRNQAA
jgi:hypothetical protein